jgi:hypothetical protein
LPCARALAREGTSCSPPPAPTAMAAAAAPCSDHRVHDAVLQFRLRPAMRRMETARESVGLSLVLAFKSLQSASWEPSAAARRVLPPPTTRARLGVCLKVRWPALERTLKLCLCPPLVCTGYAPERRWCPLRRRRRWRRTNSSVLFVGLSSVEPSQTNPLGFSRDGLPWVGLRVGPVINRTMYRVKYNHVWLAELGVQPVPRHAGGFTQPGSPGT